MIGCGVNFRNYTAFFTKNGVKIGGSIHGSIDALLADMLTSYLGTAFHDVIRGKLHPAISLKKPGEYIRANFGQSPFVYNIDDLMRVRVAELTQPQVGLTNPSFRKSVRRFRRRSRPQKRQRWCQE